MSQVSLFVIAIGIGFVALSWSADRLIEVASTLAARLGMSTLMIGMTIVAFGTSAPELLVSFIASYDGNSGIAVGNALGSNIINTGLVLSICGICYPLTISHRINTREIPLLCLVTALALVLMMDGLLSEWDGILLGMGLVAYCYYIARNAGNNTEEQNEVVILPMCTTRAILETLFLLGVLLGSSKLLIWGASELARSFGISEVVIGLTVVAFGTSLPELAAGLASARKGMFDMLLAMIIGSNIFNLLGVLAFPGIVGGGITLDSAVAHRDGLAMLILTSILAINALTSLKKDNTVISDGAMTIRQKSYASLIPAYKHIISLVFLLGYLGVLMYSIIGSGLDL